MKLARIGDKGSEAPAIAASDGTWRDVSSVVSDISVEAMDAVARLSDDDIAGLPILPRGSRFGVPLTGIGKFICIGLNYRDHAEEAAMPIPTEPVIFMKAVSCLGGPDDDVGMPQDSTMMDWEVELGIIVGKTASYVQPEAALEHVAGYVLVNDLSERFDQLQRGGSWDKGKSHDGFGPVGPWLVTADELGNASDLRLTAKVNGVVMQDGRTSNMIFPVREIVTYVSRFMTLEPGDLIITGTPAGVGMGQRPEPVFLKAGDIVELSGEGLGSQRQKVISH